MEYTPCPSRIICGDSPAWVYLHPDYPASDGWVATIYFSSAAETPLAVPGTTDVDGRSFDFALTAAQSQKLLPGRVRFTIRATLANGLTTSAGLIGPQTLTLAYDNILVIPDPTVPVDRRSSMEIDLAAVEAGITARMTGTIMDEYVIGGMTVKMPQLEKLFELRSRLKAAIKRERGRPPARAIPIHLSPHKGGILPFGNVNRVRG